MLASIRTPLSSSAWELGPLFNDISVFVNKARGIDAVVSLVTMLLLVTFDLDRPTRGLIQVPDAPIAQLRASMDQPPAGG